MSRVVLSVFVALTVLLAPLRVPAAQTPDRYCGLNTGLDPACPITALGIDESTTVLNGAATVHTDSVFGSWALNGTRELTVTLPLYDHLGISGVGNAFGMGDIGVGYTQAFGGRTRLTPIAGFSTTFVTGAAAFSAGRTQMSPLVGVSYALGNRISLVAIGQYTFDVGGTTQPFAPRTQELTITPRVIFASPKFGMYSVLDLQGSSVTGDERYQQYHADATVGIVRARYDLSVTYGVPIARYTREYAFYHTIGASVSWRP